MTASSLRPIVLLFSALETFVVEPGEAVRTLSLSPVSRFVLQHGVVREDVSPQLRASVAGRDVISSFPVDSKPSHKEDMLLFLFQLGACSVGLVSDCVLASLGYGLTSCPCRVVLVGIFSIACAAVERGSVEYFIASKHHGVLDKSITMRKGEDTSSIEVAETASSVSLLQQLATVDIESDLQLRSRLFQRHSHSSSSSSIFVSLLRRLPSHFSSSPIIIGGDGSQVKGFAALFRQHILDSDLGADIRSLPEPWLAVMYGASLVGSLPDAELRKLLVTRDDLTVHGPSLIHMRTP